MVLFNDLKRAYQATSEETNEAVMRVLKSGWYILGRETEEFEHNFASYIGTSYCVGVASGTEAIALSLMACGIGPGDEVITTNLTAYPTITGILQSGATPVVADISLSDGLLDPTDLEHRIAENTRAIVPVHLYGQSCDMDPIIALAKKYQLKVVEDCAQATGATYQAKKCGSFGECGAFSFYPTKNLGAMGDAGAITTNDELIFRRLIELRNYGQSKRYFHDSKGINSRLDEIQAAILNVGLQHLERRNFLRGEISRFYRNNLQTVDCLSVNGYGEPVNHLFVVRSGNRDHFMEYLADRGIQTLIHYPVPINRQKAFAGQKEEVFENTELFSASIVSLPLYPELLSHEFEEVTAIVNQYVW